MSLRYRPVSPHHPELRADLPKFRQDYRFPTSLSPQTSTACLFCDPYDAKGLRNNWSIFGDNRNKITDVVHTVISSSLGSSPQANRHYLGPEDFRQQSGDNFPQNEISASFLAATVLALGCSSPLSLAWHQLSAQCKQTPDKGFPKEHTVISMPAPQHRS